MPLVRRHIRGVGGSADFREFLCKTGSQCRDARMRVRDVGRDVGQRHQQRIHGLPQMGCIERAGIGMNDHAGRASDGRRRFRRQHVEFDGLTGFVFHHPAFMQLRGIPRPSGRITCNCLAIDRTRTASSRVRIPERHVQPFIAQTACRGRLSGRRDLVDEIAQLARHRRARFRALFGFPQSRRRFTWCLGLGTLEPHHYAC
ncbi:hypothetical protein [Burkholderia lata]|uniref:hypothetical protein n=1 Tax=Burkholderia lata (strain ATCC 17760 / DSM 23089 / LMG 22485 / NCIMB 9086 / R18194 / 383) TaxID=482957 RepID=UPI0015841398|nr:hypothetical protein [Burkholderia lata]